MALITCKNVSIYYDRQPAVLQANFEINMGDYICILGENGSGKTSLIKGILGLLPLNSGQIIYSDGLLRNEVGYLPQQTAMQRDFPASVWEVALSGCSGRYRWYPFYSTKDKIRVKENLSRMGILHLSQKSYRDLSGGQQQRVLLARALCASEKILFLDEPITGLDPIATNEMYHLIGQINKDSNIAIVMVSHDINTATKYAQKILHMDTKILYFGDTAGYLNSAPGKGWLGGTD